MLGLNGVRMLHTKFPQHCFTDNDHSGGSLNVQIYRILFHFSKFIFDKCIFTLHRSRKAEPSRESCSTHALP